MDFSRTISKMVPKSVKRVIVAAVDKVEDVQKNGLSALDPRSEASGEGSENNNKGRDDNQIAGHDADEFGRKRMIFKDGKVYKLYDPKDSRGANERKLFEVMQVSDPAAMGAIIPNYYGTEVLEDPEARKPGDYVVMENIFQNINNGKDLCLADIKIGDTPTPFETKKDLGHEMLNDAAGAAYKRMFVPNLDRYGFQVLGIKVKNSETGNVEKFGKSLGRASTALGVDYIVGKFFLGCQINQTYRVQVIQELIQDLVVIENWLSVQTKYKFRGSSLILAYIPETVCPGLPTEFSRKSSLNQPPQRPPPIRIPSHLPQPGTVTGDTPTPSSIPFAGMEQSMPVVNPNMGNTHHQNHYQNQSTAYPPQQNNACSPQQNPYAHTTTHAPLPQQHSMYPNLHPILTHNNSYPNQTTIPPNNYSHQNLQNFQNNQPRNFHHSPSLPQMHSLNLNSGTRVSTQQYPVIPMNHFNTSGKKAIVRLIDFNNWRDGEGQIDDDSLKGVRGLIEHLKEQLSYSEN